MSDYIKREDAEKLKDINTDTEADKEYFIEQLNAIPAADVEPVRHGRWTYICNSPMTKLKVVECSVCHKRAYGSAEYCPNCGAKMDGDK